MTKDHNLDSIQDKRQITLSGNEQGIIIRIKGDGNCLFRAVVESFKHLELSPELADCFSDHIKLRQKVIEELRKKSLENVQAIKSTISDEIQKPASEITDQDIDIYLDKMATSETWAGTPEIQAIAMILKMRIIIHQDQTNIHIPQGAEYDKWPIAVALVHEAADKSALNSPTNNNHYNLAIKTTIAEKIISQNQEERSRSDSEGSSGHSAQFNMGFSTPLKSKFLGQTIDFDLREGTQDNEVRCVLVFGKDRAPTIVKGAQGRHVSSSALFIEAVKSRTDGLDVEEAIDEVVNLVFEYGKETSEGMIQFKKFVEQRKDKLILEKALSKQDREKLYKLETEEIKKLSALIDLAREASQTQLLQGLEAIKESIEERHRILSPIENRNKIKKCDLWAYQGCLIDVIKAAVVTLNMMENSAFEGLTQKTRQELAREGGVTTGVVGRYRSGNIGATINANKIAQDMAKLFDYPVSDIIEKSRHEKKDDSAIIEDFYQATRRHEKLFYDSFKCIRDLPEKNILAIRQAFFSQILRTGWEKELPKLGDKVTAKQRFSRYSSGLDAPCLLIAKFDVNSSSLLGKAISSRAEISDDEVGYSSEEELDQVKANQKGGARK
jgi:hypothetical protein